MQAGMQVWSQGDQAAVAVSPVSCWGLVSHGGPGQEWKAGSQLQYEAGRLVSAHAPLVCISWLRPQ